MSTKVDRITGCRCAWCTRPAGSYSPLTGKQKRAAQMAEADANLWEGAVRSAKTISSILKWSQFARNERIRGDFALIGVTQDTIRRNIVGPLQELYGPRRVTFLRGMGMMQLLGRKVHVLSAHNESDVKKIKGLTLASFYGDELSEWPESVYIMALSRLSIEGARWYGTTNPGGPNHWLLKDLDRAAFTIHRDNSESYRSGDDVLPLHRFSFKLTDNPFLPPRYVDNLRRQYVGLWRKRLIDGEWCQAEGAIYDMFDHDRHVVDRLPTIVRYIAVGVDYGTTNPTSAVLIGLGADGVLYVVSEWWYDSKESHRQLTDTEYSAEIRRWLAALDIEPEYLCVDPSAASFRLQLYRDGLSPRPADNDVADGLRTVASLFATDKLKIHASAVGLIKEIPSYTWDDRASQKGLDQPVKQNDHSCDALRYALATTELVWHRDIYG